MRYVTANLLLISLAAVGCSGANTTAAAAGNSLSPAPAATTGRTDAAPAAARAREITIPAGTPLPIVLDTAVGSDISRAEQRVAAHLTRPVTFHGQTVLPAGSRVSGVVTDATRSARVKGRAHVAVRFDSLSPSGDDERYEIRAASIGRTAAGTKRKDALEIGAPAAGGAVIGALVGGKKGALIGSAVGGGAGTGVVLSTRGKEVRLAKGTPLTLRLAAPVTIRVRE